MAENKMRIGIWPRIAGMVAGGCTLTQGASLSATGSTLLSIGLVAATPLVYRATRNANLSDDSYVLKRGGRLSQVLPFVYNAIGTSALGVSVGYAASGILSAPMAVAAGATIFVSQVATLTAQHASHYVRDYEARHGDPSSAVQPVNDGPSQVSGPLSRPGLAELSRAAHESRKEARHAGANAVLDRQEPKSVVMAALPGRSHNNETVHEDRSPSPDF